MSYEDDRIRHKNRLSNEAYDLYQGLKALGYSHSDIIKYVQFAVQNGDQTKNNHYQEILNIISRFDSARSKEDGSV